MVSEDDGIRVGVTAQALSGLKPVFKKGGTTTAGNSSQVSCWCHTFYALPGIVPAKTLLACHWACAGSCARMLVFAQVDRPSHGSARGLWTLLLTVWTP